MNKTARQLLVNEMAKELSDLQYFIDILKTRFAQRDLTCNSFSEYLETVSSRRDVVYAELKKLV